MTSMTAGAAAQSSLLGGLTLLIAFAGALLLSALAAESDSAPSRTGLVAGAQVGSGVLEESHERVEVPCSDDGEVRRISMIDPGGSERVRLLVEAGSVRPGESFAIAPLNLTSSSISYGLFTSAENPNGTELSGSSASFVPLIGLSASPGKPGACATISIPNSTAPGSYVAVLEDVEGRDFPKADVKAPFEVVGAPRHEENYVPAGVTPAESPVRPLYEPQGEPLNTRRMNPSKVSRTAETVPGVEVAALAIVPRFNPEGVSLVLLDGVAGDVPAVLNALRGEGIDTNRIVLETSPFNGEHVKKAANEASAVLRDEPAQSWGVSYAETEGKITVEASELTIEAFDEINRIGDVPVRFLIGAGSE